MEEGVVSRRAHCPIDKVHLACLSQGTLRAESIRRGATHSRNTQGLETFSMIHCRSFRGPPAPTGTVPFLAAFWALLPSAGEAVREYACCGLLEKLEGSGALVSSTMMGVMVLSELELLFLLSPPPPPPLLPLQGDWVVFGNPFPPLHLER